MNLPGCSADGMDYVDTNPFWYSFTCYVGGTLGFIITPEDLNDDYDWMVYDITGHDPNDAYTMSNLIVIGNWAGTPGLTGARNGGSDKIKCASFPPDSVTTFSSMPVLIEGHNYLLFISHYNQTRTGYSLSFNGGTAIISNSKKPKIQSANIYCDGKTLSVTLNKHMRCNSLASDGSDFSIANKAGLIKSASGSNCNSAFDMDSITLILNVPLATGTYTLTSKTGSDGNTLLDDCGSQLDVGETIDFNVVQTKAAALDSMTAPTCSPTTLQIKISDPILCSSIAADGSDFTISGNQIVGVSGASGNCENGLTRIINIILSSPIVTGGTYQVKLNKGSDGNTILNQCGSETEVNSAISFTIKDTVSASFSFNVNQGCNSDTIHLSYSPLTNVSKWEWMILGTDYKSSDEEPSIIENVFGPKIILHTVSNGFCSDSTIQTINLENDTIKAKFQVSGDVCPQDLVSFTNTSIGNLVSWSWNFDDGSFSTDQSPPDHLFPNIHGGKTFTVSLIVENNIGCYDTAMAQITKLQSCAVGVPNAFTPNGDGINDYLYPANTFNVTNLEFQVFNRYGQVVFETRDGTKKWDGRMNGQMQPTGTYVWMLGYTDESGRKISQTGSTILIR
jgi:gliding motility-associated-like protein